MADAMHDDEPHERFTPLREDAGAVRARDTQISRRAGRRMQIILIASAIAAVIVISVSVAFMTTLGPRSASPMLSQAELDDLANSASRTLWEHAPGFSRKFAVTAESKDAALAISHSGSSPLKWSQGQEYELAALCLGRGSVILHWQAPGRVTGKLPVTCAESGKIARTRFTPLADGQLVELTVKPDDEAVGRAGMAVNIVEFQ